MNKDFIKYKISLSCWLLLFGVLNSPINAQTFENRAATSLNGEWNFALDPGNRGEALDWYAPWQPLKNSITGLQKDWDKVEVPHSYSIDKRYEGYHGHAWYKRTFTFTGDPTTEHVRLRFEAVYYKCHIWLNGHYVGLHEGGYTPFEFDVTDLLKVDKPNYLSIKVDNSWDLTTLPGMRVDSLPKHQVYPWLEYGGITRDVSLIVTDRVFVVKQKIETMPDLRKGTAKVKVITWINNEYHEPKTVSPTFTFFKTNKDIQPRRIDRESMKIDLPPETIVKYTAEYQLSREDVDLWHFSDPQLYELKTILNMGSSEMDAYQERFGIREVKIEGTKLLLNGEPIRLGGANRHSDHPQYASMDNQAVAETDLRPLKEGNMQLMRLQHIPPSRAFMDWCDENGMLIIAEASNWQISPQMMVNPVVQAKYKQQAREIIERDWSRPSIIGYSVGNEYMSWTEQGDEWTRIMADFTRSLDDTRFLTFSALAKATREGFIDLAHDSFRHCDLLSFNYYSGGARLGVVAGRLNEKYPHKPIFISEFGKRADKATEEERIEHFNAFIKAANELPYIIGLSWWSFNDYRSKFFGSNPDGTRPWGMVDSDRKPRALYYEVARQMAPATLEIKGDQLTISAKSGYPAYTLKGYKVKFSDNEITTLNTLKPGQKQTIAIPAGTEQIQLLAPNDFKVITKQL